MRERNGGIRGAAMARVALRSGLAGLLAGAGVTAASAKLQAPSSTLTQSNPVQVAIVDVDNANGKDIVVADADSISDNSKVWLNDGTGSFKKGSQLPVIYSFAVGDVDGQNGPDLWVITRPSGTSSGKTNAVLLNDGSGQFASPGPEYALGEDATTVGEEVLADLDDDQRLDCVRAMRDSNAKDLVFFGKGDGTFFTPPTSRDTGSTRGLVAADLQNDGKPEVILANEATSDPGDREGLVMYDNTSGTPVATLSSISPGDYTDVATGMLGTDGVPDIVATTSSGKNEAWQGRADASFVPAPTPTLNSGVRTNAVGLADMDDDGDADVVFGTDDGIEVWYNDGIGNFPAAPDEKLSLGTVTDLALGDLDGDGRTDAVVITGSDVKVLMNTPTSSGGAGATLPIGSGGGGGGALGPWWLLLLAAAGLRRRWRTPA